jgi:hypothetical protein
MNPKMKSMLAHLTPLGWLIAWILNHFSKDSSTSFYLRQSLGLFLCFFIFRLIPEYYIIAWAFFFIFWIYSFVGTIKEVENVIPFAGAYFQKWFRQIS